MMQQQSNAMNAERLLQHYERIADAPDAIARLRRFILDLAVRGKLVPQDPNDEPAKVLHAQLAKQFAEQSIGKGRGRRSEIAAGLIYQPPYAAPAGWHWVRMGELGETNIGLTYSPNDLNSDGVPVLRSNNVQEGKIALDDLVRVTTELKSSVMVRQGDMLICARNGSRALVGKAAIIDRLPEPMAFGAFMAIFRSPINLYLHLFLTSPVFRQVIDEVNTNTINQITQANLRSTLVPLPPLAEQRRIVAKVDELMGLCDRLDAARAGREAARDRLAAASLARLNAPDPETFQSDARFALDALPALTTRPDQIKRLRQTILNLAVRGKLVPQDASDESAASELRKVEKLKAKQDIKKPKKIAPIEDVDKWCLTPIGWVWARWDQITDWITYGFTRPMEHVNEGVPIVTGKNVNEGQIIFETASLTPMQLFDALNEKDKPQPGDILITKDGSIGRTAIVEAKHLPFCINQSVAVMWLRSCHFDRRFLKLVLDSPQTQGVLSEKTAGVAIKHISVTDLGKMVFPLPPLAEQHRIVAKVDALMALCDRLEASLAATAATRRRLLDALLAEALAPVDAREMEAAG